MFEPDKKLRAAESMALECQLPPEVIQHIQSFLGGREAAQTSIVSKIWYTAWSTRSILFFDGKRNYQVLDNFSNYVRRTVHRYQELNLKVEKFIFKMRIDNDIRRNTLADELIKYALNFRVSELDLAILDVTFSGSYVLPAQVFTMRSLKKLSVKGCEINQLIEGRVLCSDLESLRLRNVVVSDYIISTILLGCPLIKFFDISAHGEFRNINVCKTQNLVDLHVAGSIPTTVKFEDHGRINVCGFCKLRFLWLEKVIIDHEFFNEFSSRFPSICDLTLKNCYGYEQIRISSHSLNNLSLDEEENQLQKAEFDVPNIRNFELKAVCIPDLSFTTASRNWESHIVFSCSSKILVTSWFLELRKFLLELSLSRISLRIKFFRIRGICVKDLPCFVTPVVENLMLNMDPSSANPSLFRGLLRICRPNIITQSKFDPYLHMYKFLKPLFNRLIWRNNQNHVPPEPNILDIYGIEEVIVEVFEENLMEWQIIPLAKLIDAPDILQAERSFRFCFRWGRLSHP